MKRVLALVLFCPTLAAAQPSETPPQPQPADDSKVLGVGYKLGDGIGFFGGDVIVNVAPHVTVDLYGTYFTVTTGTQTGNGYAFAPALQGHLYDGQRSTPYVGIGPQYAAISLGDVTGTAVGGFANIGYEWKWQNGFGVQLGGGVQYMQKATATNGAMTVSIGGAVNPNLELGIRYMFL